MGGVSTPELAGHVAKAGALGMLCEFDVAPGPERMQTALDIADGGAVGMGFFGHWLDGDLATFETAAATLRVVEVFWTDPDAAVVARARNNGPALVAWQVGTVDAALAAADVGCDFVVVQGVEAGGHVCAVAPLRELLDGVLGRVAIPVVAAGGITTSRQAADVIGLGAAGVRVGTRFVAAVESGAHPDYVQALIDARDGDETVVTTVFAGGWPDAPHRVLRSAVTAVEALADDTVGYVAGGGQRHPIARYDVSPPGRDAEGHIDAMALYAGMGVGDVRAAEPAADIVADLVAQLPD